MMHEAQQPGDERSLGELLGDLTREFGTLVRQEVDLAKTEMTQKATRVGKDVGFLAAGGAIAYAGFLALLAALIILLDQVMPLGVAALLVGAIVAGGGAFLVMKGLTALKQEDLVPHETIESLKETRHESTGVRSRAARPS